MSPSFEDRIPAGFEVEVSARVIDFGKGVRIRGTLDRGEEALDGEEVTVEADPYPFNESWVPAAAATSDAKGDFSARVKPDENTDFRATFGEGETQSDALRVYVEPRATLSASTDVRDSGEVARFRTLFEHPEDRSIQGSSVFHYATTTAEARATGELPFARVTPIREIEPGRSVATLAVEGASADELVYATCIKWAGGAGMGRPGTACSQRSTNYRP